MAEHNGSTELIHFSFTVHAIHTQNNHLNSHTKCAFVQSSTFSDFGEHSTLKVYLSEDSPGTFWAIFHYKRTISVPSPELLSVPSTLVHKCESSHISGKKQQGTSSVKVPHEMVINFLSSGPTRLLIIIWEMDKILVT